MGAKYQVRDKKDGRRKEPFVMVPFRWMDLPAYKALSGNAVRLLLHLIRLSGGDNGAGSDQGELFLSERSAAEALDMARNTAAAAFDMLVEKGWLRPVRLGHFDRKAVDRGMRATVWRLTSQVYPQGKMGPTSEFMRWEPEENQRAQKLNGSGSKIEHSPPFDVDAGPIIEPEAEVVPSDAPDSNRSIIEPHLDIAKGERSEEDGLNSERPIETANDPTNDPIREQVAKHCRALGKAGCAALAKRCGLTPSELLAFTGGRMALPIGKQMALRTAARVAA
jgi:hypothetical protein